MHIDWQSVIFDLTSKFQDGGYDVILCSNVLCCQLVSENETSAMRICSKAVSSLSVVHSYLYHKYIILFIFCLCLWSLKTTTQVLKQVLMYYQ